MLNFLTCISTTFSKQAVKALARLCVCARADSEGGGGAWGLDPDCAYAHGRIQRGDMGSGPPPPHPEKSQNYRVF